MAGVVDGRYPSAVHFLCKITDRIRDARLCRVLNINDIEAALAQNIRDRTRVADCVRNRGFCIGLVADDKRYARLALGYSSIICHQIASSQNE